VLEDLPSRQDIARLTDRLLREAGAYGRLPTPVGDILAAAELVEAPQTFLSASSIAEARATSGALDASPCRRGQVHDDGASWNVCHGDSPR